MGSHLHVYLGPYLACKVVSSPHTITVVACTSLTCPKDKPRNIGKAQFCDACGSPIGPVEVTVDRRPSPWDGLCSERLFHIESADGFYYYGVNEGKVAPRNFAVEEGTHVDLSNVLAASEIAWFVQRYEDETKGLREAHTSVEVHWGVHSYYM